MSRLTLKSEQQILGGMIQKILAKTGLNDINPGSVLLTLLEAAASEDFAQYYQMLQIVRNYNVDTTTGSDLDNRAFEFGLNRKQARAATGKIRILREAGFEKISTSFYTGFRSRISGDTILPVNDASKFPSSGSLVVGRGTTNEEEVAYSALPVDKTNYFEITLDTPLTNDHLLEETVILLQGTDITIPAGTAVQVPATSRSTAITFNTTRVASILAGEEFEDDIDVRCIEFGIKGNIGVNSITGTEAFPSPPFTGARAENNSAFTSGQDRETDTRLRNRIKSFIQALSQSTKAGISYAISDLVDPITAKRVVSSNIILPDNAGLPVKIYIDDGTGFEPSFQTQGQETIIESANGSEVRLQLDLFPLVKAQVESGKEEPYDFSGSAKTLQISVGSESETITIFPFSLAIPEASTAEELTSLINNASTLVEARTSQVGKKIVLSAKSDENENITIVGGTANTIFDFPTTQMNTFYLYKNDLLLSKDGETAFIDSVMAPYDFSGIDKTLFVVVDGKTANIQSVLIRESDFDSPAAAAQASASEVADIINEQLAGATAIDSNGRVRIISNTELSAKSKIKINAFGGPSDVNSVLNFDTAEIVGKNQDYKLNPELGVIELVEPLERFDKLTAGSRNTRAFLTASLPEEYSIIGGSDVLKIKIDGGATQTINIGAQSNITAQALADIINNQLNGGTALTRTYGDDIFLEIRTNTYGNSGSIELVSTGSTANAAFGFQADSIVTSLVPHTAYSIATESGPFTFLEGQTLVVVLDNDPAGKTFVITMDFDGLVTGGLSTTEFSTDLYNAFLENNEIRDFWLVAKSGENTISGTVETILNPSGNTFRYVFEEPPVNFEDFSIGDQVSFSDMQNANNEGHFLVDAITVQNTVHTPVEDFSLSNPSSLSPVLGDRYLVNPNAGLALQLSVIDKDIYNPDALIPSLNDRYIIAEEANDSILLPVNGLYVDSNNPSVEEIHGRRYLINGTGLNDWAGHNWEIAEYNGVGTPGWIFYTPVDKDVTVDSSSSTIYQFEQSLGYWIENQWGGKAGKIATWNGTNWVFTTPTDKEIREVTSESLFYQYDMLSNSWTRNDWGSKGNQIAEWNGSAWDFTVAVLNDVVEVISESESYQYNGTNWTFFKFWVEVTNTAGTTETGSSGTGLIGQRRKITDYTAISGLVQVATPFRTIPDSLDEIIVLPSTKENVRDFFSNLRVTSLGARSYIELADDNQFVQISSRLNGSEGFVQVTGGRANLQLKFSTSKLKGLQAYSYYVGLVKLVHKTIYGDESDLVSFPGTGAAGIKFQILAPTVQEVSVVLDITLVEGVSLSNVENNVKSAVMSYINSLGVASNVIISQIIERVVNVEGVIDVKILSPNDNIQISENELARTKASIISVV